MNAELTSLPRPNHTPDRTFANSLSMPPAAKLRDEEITRSVTTALTHPSILQDRGRVISDAEIESLGPALTTRVEHGRLEVDQVLTFTSCIANGGVPVPLLLEDPLIPLDMNDVHEVNDGLWVPPYLKERTADPEKDLGIQQLRVVHAIQQTLVTLESELPVFFIGSAAVPRKELPTDIDIGTGQILRSLNMPEYDAVFSALRSRMAQDPLILGNKNHVGALFPEMTLAIGVSVTRYGRALRVTPDHVIAIEGTGSLAP